MKRGPRAAAAAALGVALLGGCSLFRLAGRAPDRGPEPGAALPPDAYEVGAATATRARAADQELPESRVEAEALFYEDLGPDTIDVSAYPTQQKYNYQAFAAVCSRCHTLARPINSPRVSRAAWELYMLGMRASARLQKGPAIGKDERKAILDFLAYDSRERKVARRDEFRRQTAELKRRFDPILRERLRRLQRSRQPVLLD